MCEPILLKNPITTLFGFSVAGERLNVRFPRFSNFVCYIITRMWPSHLNTYLCKHNSSSSVAALDCKNKHTSLYKNSVILILFIPSWLINIFDLPFLTARFDILPLIRNNAGSSLNNSVIPRPTFHHDYTF